LLLVLVMLASGPAMAANRIGPMALAARVPVPPPRTRCVA